MDEELEENSNNENVGASNPFTMMLGATLGAEPNAAARDITPEEWWEHIENHPTGNYKDHGDKRHIRPAKSGSGQWSKTRKIKTGDEKNIVRLIYSPTNNISNAKTVWRENEIVIDGMIYTYVEIGNLCWLQQNLLFAGGLTNSKAKNYPKQVIDTDMVINRGALYRNSNDGTASNDEINNYVKNIIPDGWRLPTNADFQDLINTIGTDPKKYRAVDASTNSTYCGTDDYGLGLMNAGYNTSNGSKPYNFDTACYISPALNSNDVFAIENNSAPTIKSSFKNNKYLNVRLCRDRKDYEI